MLTDMDGKKFRNVFCLISILMMMMIGTDAEYPDLSKLDISVSAVFDTSFIEIKHPFIAGSLQASCGNCHPTRKADKAIVKCETGSFVKMTIDIVIEGRRYDIPLNVTCNHETQASKIVGLHKTFVGASSAFLSWNKMANIDHYLVIVMDRRRIYNMTIDAKSDTFNISGLTERMEHQICIASVDKRWRTSDYACLKFETDFTTTGPVENATTTIENDTSVIVTWKKPRYRLDQPQGYVVTIKDESRKICRLFEISIGGSLPNVVPQEGCTRVIRQWKELQSLIVNELFPHSKYVLSIRPINSGRMANVTELMVQTEEGESGPVSNMKAKDYRKPHLFVSFKKPDQPNGLIHGYRIRIYLTMDSVCQRMFQKLVIETNITTMDNWINVENLKPCRKYRVDVAAVNGWRKNDGVGRYTSVDYTHETVESPSVLGEFLTSNLLRLSWKTDQRFCDNSVMVVRVKTALEQPSCVNYVVSDGNCDGMKQQINSSDAECSSVSIQAKTNFLSKGILLITPKVEQLKRQYVVSVSIFVDMLRSVMNATNMKGFASFDCFTDCNSDVYDGIRSATMNGQKCSPWRTSNWPNYRNAISNFCRKETLPWCPVTNNERKWDFCNVPNCSSIETATGCVMDTQLTTNNSSVSVSWSQPTYANTSAGYVVLLHDVDDICVQYAVHLCKSCNNVNSLSMEIKSFFISCETMSKRNISGNSCEFADLNQDTSYFVYIISFLDKSNGADVKRLSVKTKMAVPTIPKNVTITKQDTNNLAFAWTTPLKSDKYGPTISYLTRLINTSRHDFLSANISNNFTSYHDLQSCTEYCFSVSAANSKGYSPFSELCTNTKAPVPGVVVLNEIPTYPGSERTVSWSYRGDSCSKFFHVLYWTPDNATNPKRLKSSVNATSVVLRELQKNMLYYVTVIAETTVDTETGNKRGNESHKKWFYTGSEKSKIDNFVEVLDSSRRTVFVTWTTESASSKSIFEYRIELKSATKKCLKSVILSCSGCHPVYRKKFVIKQESILKEKANTPDCQQTETTTFQHGRREFYVKFSTEEDLADYGLTLYGYTLLGTFILKDKEGSRFPWIYLSLLALLLVIGLVLAIVFCTKNSGQNVRNEPSPKEDNYYQITEEYLQIPQNAPVSNLSEHPLCETEYDEDAPIKSESLENVYDNAEEECVI